MFNKTKSSLALLAAITFSGSASAAIITQWEYSTLLTFTGAGFDSGTGQQIVNDSELSWGQTVASGGHFTLDNETTDDGNRSALTIGNPTGDSPSLVGGGEATGTVETVTTPISDFSELTLAQIGIGNTLTHWNNPISSSYATLETGALLDTLTLNPVGEPGNTVDAPSINFDFKFLETLNNPPNNGDCVSGTPEPCGDLWGFIGIQNTNLEFDFQGNTYYASVLVLGQNPGDASPIAELDIDQCTALGFDEGCQGFITNENAATTAKFGFAITVAPTSVPLPAAVWLFGSALVGFAGFSRFRKSNKA